ncbi:hypothetical protein RvY_00777 [Ramazzottius varieornatus]|uniref:Uncharacterized protein n=1 Tax=Ramazzottius varieornatus TaxID=947166 RepID=A0A1D1UDZ0_RAMVA|nr:hypothetical protein RvY_00777 [Ramazzottius varieornatus]
MSKPAKLPRKKLEKDVQLIPEPSRAVGPASDFQRKTATDSIQREADRPSRVDSELFGASLCEFVPKLTWVMDESYVHSKWYLKREEARKSRTRPWQASGLAQRWRENGQFSELEKKTSEDLGFDELDDEKLDDPHLFDFDAIEAERAAKKKQKAVKKVTIDAYALYHMPIERPSTSKEEPDSRFHYERPVRPSNKEPSEVSLPPIPVTLKAIVVDGDPAAFAACSFTGRTQRTSTEVFDQFQKCLTSCQTLLPNGPFRILPPKGISANAIYQKQASVKKGKGGKKKKSKGGRDKARKQATPPNAEEHQKINSPVQIGSPDQYVSFGDPSAPLAFADDLLQLASKSPVERETALKCLQHQEATNLREQQTMQLWRKCTTEEMWKRKRQRKVLQRYLQAHMVDSACNLHKQTKQRGDLDDSDGDHSQDSGDASRLQKPIDADDEYRTAEDTSTSIDDEDTVHCYDHTFLNDLDKEPTHQANSAASEANGPPPTAFMSFSRPELHKRAKFQDLPRDDYRDLASTNLHHLHHYEFEEDSTCYCQCESEWETDDDPAVGSADGKTPLRAAPPFRLVSAEKGSLAVDSLFDPSIRLPSKMLKKLTKRLELMGNFDVRKTTYKKPKKPLISFAVHGQKLRFVKSSVKIPETNPNRSKQSEDSLLDEVIIYSGPRRSSHADGPGTKPKSFPSREFLNSVCDGFSNECEKGDREHIDITAMTI